jgi:AraC-like DNA-binding protein/quercetin dioxygenase-like cupin family protein
LETKRENRISSAERMDRLSSAKREDRLSSVERENRISSAEREDVLVSKGKSFRIGHYKAKNFSRPWHYHPEYELMLITSGFGTRMVGDHFEPFESGDLVLIRGNLPHAWISDTSYTKPGNMAMCESVYIQFRKSVFGTHFIEIPELSGIRRVLEHAERGIKVQGNSRKEIAVLMKKLPEQTPFEQLLSLLRILNLIHSEKYDLLASEKYIEKQVSFKNEKMRRIHNYIMQNYKSEIDLSSCAEHLDMTSSSFCRMFKKHTNVTFSVYLNYIRINMAQKLLLNTSLPVKEIGYECGYESIVYFNQVFKRLCGMSPGQFRKKHG